jgi:hypothetical protein
MKIMGHRQIRPDWHILTTPNGVYFGYSKLQVFEKADAHNRQNIIADAMRFNVRPLLVRQRLVSRVAI